MTRLIHLDLVGGIAGDMFVASIFDLLSDKSLLADIENIIESLHLSPKTNTLLTDWNDGVLSGKRFEVSLKDKEGHQHRGFRTIKSIITNSSLSKSAQDRAVDIFQRLAIAEGKIHGLNAEDVTFHEVGAIDSIVDICISAFLIDQLGDCDWSASDIPLGSGFIESQHGLLPIPAPATLELLKGFKVRQDLLKGERVTPTGAALLAHLNPSQNATITGYRLGRVGYGFGTKRFKGISNVLRLTEHLVEDKDSICSLAVCQINFEVDDQTPEDLALGLNIIRGSAGVLDVTMVMGLGKKGRMTNMITVLANPLNKDTVCAHCFEQTTTIGLRYKMVDRIVLERNEFKASNGMTVKTVQRPSNITAKADNDSIGELGKTAHERWMLRNKVENDAIKTS